MSTFQVHDRINDDKGGEPSIDGFILSIPKKPLVEPSYHIPTTFFFPKVSVAIPLQAL
jgi:hypothetical protein